MKIDIGCGSKKRSPDYIGLDFARAPGVNHIINLESDPFPLADRSVDLAYSSHCFEHIHLPNNLWREISRTIKIGGQIEIWTPYPHSDDQWVLGHVAGWGWSRWDHVASQERAFYSPHFLNGGFWKWKEARYVVPLDVKERLERNGFALEIGVHHFINVVKEWGCFFEYTMDDPGLHRPKETYCHGRDGEPVPLG